MGYYLLGLHAHDQGQTNRFNNPVDLRHLSLGGNKPVSSLVSSPATKYGSMDRICNESEPASYAINNAISKVPVIYSDLPEPGKVPPNATVITGAELSKIKQRSVITTLADEEAARAEREKVLQVSL